MPHIRFHEDLLPLLRPIEDVRQHPDNDNNGDTDEIRTSIEVNGMYRPVYVQKSTGYIVAGNHTYSACLELGSQTIPVIEIDVDDETALRIMEGDNQIARLARADAAQTLRNLRALQATELGLVGTGYQEWDMARLVEQVAEREAGLFGGAPQHGEGEEHIEDLVTCPNCGHMFPGGTDE